MYKDVDSSYSLDVHSILSRAVECILVTERDTRKHEVVFPYTLTISTSNEKFGGVYTYSAHCPQ